MARSVSIRAKLLRNLVTMVLLMGIAIVATTFIGARGAVRTLSETIVGQQLENIEDRLETFFAGPARQLRLSRERAIGGLFDLTAAEAKVLAGDAAFETERDRRNAIIEPLLAAFPQVSSLMLADSRGREHMLLGWEGQWRNRVTRRDAWGDEVRWREWSESDPVPRDRRETTDYDPTVRPWFTGALATRMAPDAVPGAIHWTEPYTFFTTKQPGITGSVAYDDANGVTHVIGVDVLLEDISAFTRAMRVGERGLAAVLTEDRKLLGLPRGPWFDDPETLAAAYLQLPETLGLSVVNDGAEALAHEPDSTVRFVSGGEAWWGRAQSFEIAPGRRLRIAIVVPETDLIGNVLAQRLTIIGIVLAVLAVGVARAVVVAARFSEPVEALVEQADRIGRGDFEKTGTVVSDVTEIRRLADAHEQMRTGVQAVVKLEKVERDLDLARDIQRGLLPKNVPGLPGYEVAGWNQAADQTGGDYFDWLLLPDGKLVVTLADVTGHGIGPALIVAVYRAYIRASTFDGEQMSQALARVNDLLYADTPSERFITAVVAVVDPERNLLTHLSAGHGPNFYYQAKTGDVHEYDGDTPPLAVVPGLEFPPPNEVAIEPGDVFVLTTDGFFEWANEAGELYGVARLESFVREHHDLAPADFIAALYDAVLAHAGGTIQADDLTAVVVKRV